MYVPAPFGRAEVVVFVHGAPVLNFVFYRDEEENDAFMAGIAYPTEQKVLSELLAEVSELVSTCTFPLDAPPPDVIHMGIQQKDDDQPF